MRVAETIELDEHTERELRVLAKRRTVEARAPAASARGAAGRRGSGEQRYCRCGWSGSAPGCAVASALPGRGHRCAAQGRTAQWPACHDYGPDRVANRAGHAA